MTSSQNSSALQVHLEEYKVLSAHAVERVKLRHSMIHYAVLLLAALATAGWKIHDDNLPGWLFLLLPAPFCLVGGLLVENDLMISGLVNYHHHRLRKLIAEAAGTSPTAVMDFESHLFHIREWRPYRLFASARLGLLVFLPVIVFLSFFWLGDTRGLRLFGTMATVVYGAFVLLLLWLVKTGQLTNPPTLPPFLRAKIAPDGSVKDRPWEPIAPSPDTP